jgi:uncharacterized membrane protein YoaK (UPF0700 family)
MLAFTSGYIDAVSYLGLGSIFTSNMTGNTVLLGLALGQRKGLAALRSVIALVGYIGGAAAGSTIVDRDAKRVMWPFTVTMALATEFLVLLAFTIGGFVAGSIPGDFTLYSLTALAAIAMGIQSTAVRVLGVSGVATTYITGTWTSLVSGLTTRLRSAASGREFKKGSLPFAGTGIQAAVVSVYILAAVAGGLAETTLFLNAALVPAVIVGVVVLVALVRFRRNP